MTTPQSMRERLLHSAAALQQVTSEEDEQQALQDFNGIVDEIEAAARAEGADFWLKYMNARIEIMLAADVASIADKLKATKADIERALTPTNPPNN